MKEDGVRAEKFITDGIDMLDALIRRSRGIRLTYNEGKTIVPEDFSEEWQKLVDNPPSKFLVLAWIERKTKEAFESNRKEPFRSIIDDLSYLMVLTFGLDRTRFCIFYADREKGLFVRMSKGPHWHPKFDVFPLSEISDINKRLLYGDEVYICIENPTENGSKDLSRLIEMTGITSMEYRKVSEDWIFIVDTTGVKKRLTDDERMFLNFVCSMMQIIVMECEKNEDQKNIALKKGRKQGLEYVMKMFFHQFRNSSTAIGGLAGRAEKALAGILLPEENVLRIAKYLEHIKKNIETIEKFAAVLGVCVKNCNSVEKPNNQKVCLSKVVIEAIQELRCEEKFKDINIEFSCNLSADNNILADFEKVKTFVGRMVRKTFSSNGIKAINIDLDVQNECAAITFHHPQFKPTKIKKLYDLSDDSLNHEIDDFLLLMEIESMESKGAVIEFGESTFSVIFKRN